MILAIDPSLTGTAVVRGGEHDHEMARFASHNLGDSALDRIKRYDDLVERIMEWIGDGPFAAAYIEGYSFGSKCNRELLGEFGGLLRWRLADVTDKIYEVTPATLKKFATGKGAGGKDLVAAHLAKRYGFLFHTNDEFDAFGLYRLGLVCEGLVGADNQAQREAADRVLGLAPAKKRTRQRLE